MNKYKSAKKGIFKPKNPHKWVQNKIIFRSNIERKYFSYFDVNPKVILIASERIVIPYFDPIKNKLRKYYVDLIIKYQDKNQNIKVKLIEIKSSGEVNPPKKPKRITNNYKQSVMTYLTNKAKWDAATKWAEKNNFEFVVLSEKNL
jgi:hypothetical protein